MTLESKLHTTKSKLLYRCHLRQTEEIPSSYDYTVMCRESDSIWTSALTLSSHLHSHVTVFTIFAQAGGLVAAYIIEITLHYEKLLETHCRVPNFWPSISRSTGDYLPGRFVARLAVSLVAFPRLIDAFLYLNFFAARRHVQEKRWYRWLNRVNYLLSIMELLLLYTMTFVSLKENIDIHTYAWIAFIAFSTSHMITFLILFGVGFPGGLETWKAKISMTVRGIMFTAQVISVATFFHYALKHIWYCQAYAYSFAAISECAIAASNLGFQSMKLLDFKSLKSVYHWNSNNLLKMTKSD